MDLCAYCFTFSMLHSPVSACSNQLPPKGSWVWFGDRSLQRLLQIGRINNFNSLDSLWSSPAQSHQFCTPLCSTLTHSQATQQDMQHKSFTFMSAKHPVATLSISHKCSSYFDLRTRIEPTGKPQFFPTGKQVQMLCGCALTISLLQKGLTLIRTANTLCSLPF